METGESMKNTASAPEGTEESEGTHSVPRTPNPEPTDMDTGEGPEPGTSALGPAARVSDGATEERKGTSERDDGKEGDVVDTTASSLNTEKNV